MKGAWTSYLVRLQLLYLLEELIIIALLTSNDVYEKQITYKSIMTLK